jgi:hypothetical protein
MKGPIFCGQRDKSILEHETIQCHKNILNSYFKTTCRLVLKKKFQNKNFHKFVTKQEP